MKRAGLLMVLVIFSADCWAQSLADVARKERERQSRIRSNATYSNSGVTAAVSATSSSTLASKGPTPSSGPADNKGRDEKYWRTAFQQARDALNRAQDKALLLDLKLKDMNSQLLQRSDIYNREYTIGPQITATEAELEQANREVELARQHIAQLEEELRTSGGLPGWSR